MVERTAPNGVSFNIDPNTAQVYVDSVNDGCKEFLSSQLNDFPYDNSLGEIIPDSVQTAINISEDIYNIYYNAEQEYQEVLETNQNAENTINNYMNLNFYYSITANGGDNVNGTVIGYGDQFVLANQQVNQVDMEYSVAYYNEFIAGEDEDVYTEDIVEAVYNPSEAAYENLDSFVEYNDNGKEVTYEEFKNAVQDRLETQNIDFEDATAEQVREATEYVIEHKTWEDENE